jgi:surface antigen
MYELHTDVTQTTPATHRRRWTRVLAVGAIAAAAVAGMASTAHASATTGYRIAGTAGAGSTVVSDPTGTTATTVATLTDGTAFTVDCGIRGRSVNGNTVWHHITSPVTGYIADYYTNTPGFNQLIAGETTCGATQVVVTSAPGTAARGKTITYNEGYAGSCVFYALDRFHRLTGVYPKAFGDARFLATSAAANGWTVSATPRVNSIAIFQPGNNGAAAGTGHAVWVEQVSGARIYIGEMNAPTAGVVTHRWIDTPAAAVRYIYAP